MPALSTILSPHGMQTVSFATTPRMSTYLLAWTITDFVFKESKTKRGIPVRVYTAEDKINGVDVALKAAVKSIDAYEEYFNILYPLPKADLIGIPTFPVGAMENW
jgi:aminopeptidase N